MKKNFMLLLALIGLLVFLAGSVSAAQTRERLDFNCDGTTDTSDTEAINEIFTDNFNLEFTKEDINDIECSSLKSFVIKNYNFGSDELSVVAVTDAVQTIANGCTCYWTPEPGNIAYQDISAGHNSLLFLDGYYEKRLLCWEGKWRTPKYETDWQAWFESEGQGDWRIQITNQEFGDWSVINSDYWGKKWLQDKGTCFWPLGSRNNPTQHDDLLFINSATEKRLLCFNGEWYKTRYEDFLPFASVQDVFPKNLGDVIGSWKNIDFIWQKVVDDDDGDDDDGKRKETVLPISLSGKFCEVNWQCSGWSECSNGIITRTCNDISQCDSTYNEPLEATGCEMPKIEKVKVEDKINYITLAFWIFLALIVILILVIIFNRI